MTTHRSREPRRVVPRRAARTSRAPPPRRYLTASSSIRSSRARERSVSPRASLLSYSSSSSPKCASFPRCARPRASRASSAALGSDSQTHSHSSLCLLAPCEINASTGSSNKFCISTDAAVRGASANQRRRRRLGGAGQRLLRWSEESMGARAIMWSSYRGEGFHWQGDVLTKKSHRVVFSR